MALLLSLYVLLFGFPDWIAAPGSSAKVALSVLLMLWGIESGVVIGLLCGIATDRARRRA